MIKFFGVFLLLSISLFWVFLQLLFITRFYSVADPDAPVFEMLYERNPIHSDFERRLEVSTRPLNIIYNPQAIKKVADFFYKGRVHTSG